MSEVSKSLLNNTLFRATAFAILLLPKNLLQFPRKPNPQCVLLSCQMGQQFVDVRRAAPQIVTHFNQFALPLAKSLQQFECPLHFFDNA